MFFFIPKCFFLFRHVFACMNLMNSDPGILCWNGFNSNVRLVLTTMHWFGEQHVMVSDVQRVQLALTRARSATDAPIARISPTSGLVLIHQVTRPSIKESPVVCLLVIKLFQFLVLFFFLWICFVKHRLRTEKT